MKTTDERLDEIIEKRMDEIIEERMVDLERRMRLGDSMAEELLLGVLVIGSTAMLVIIVLFLLFARG